MKFLPFLVLITKFVICNEGFSSTEANDEGSMTDTQNIDHRRATKTEISSTISERDIGSDDYPDEMKNSFAYDPQEEERKRLKDSIKKRLEKNSKKKKPYIGPEFEIGTTSTSSGVAISFSIKKALQENEES